MKIAVMGLWHLGIVTAACLAEQGHIVIGYDTDSLLIEKLQAGQPSVAETGLTELIQKNSTAGRLVFTTASTQLSQADIIWITYDTPVDEDDHANVEFVIKEITAAFPFFKQTALVIVSSQLPVGSTRRLQQCYRDQYPQSQLSFSYSPENLRLGKAIQGFTHPDRIIVGTASEDSKKRLQELLNPFTPKIVWMSLESAEMTKHALNAFLATSIVFINEIATICEQVGADAFEVEQGLKSESRIGPSAYLRPGNAFGGGTLARDVHYLQQISRQKKLSTPLFSAILESNQIHHEWTTNRLKEVIGNLTNKVIAVLGLTYKPDTDTLHHSKAVETCRWLEQQGAQITAYDPAITQLPVSLQQSIKLCRSYQEALQGANALIIATEWPEFKNLHSQEIVTYLQQPIVFDAGGFLSKILETDQRIRYFTVGKTT